MKRTGLTFILFALAFISHAQTKIIQLYDGAAPGSENWTWARAANDSNMFHTMVVYNVVHPTLTVFEADPAVANGTAVIIAPGGAFHTLSVNSEGIDEAKFLNKKGITAFVLEYRVVHSLTTDPVKELLPLLSTRNFKLLDSINAPVVKMAMEDGLTAMAYVRKNAAAYHINPNKIGFMGFSAGGTVTMCVVYNASADTRPNFIAPIYAYADAILGSVVPKEKTPAFIVAASDDWLVPPGHSVAIYTKWLDAKQSAELHMYAKGSHGFGMNKQGLPVDTWIDRFCDWLGQQGFLTKK
jgi:acetyl esterase/lipase